MLSKLLRWSIAVSAFLIGLRIGCFTLGTVFMTWDDEGYILLSIKHYMAGGHLYTQVFTQYGPVFYFLESFLFHLFHQPLTHDGGRRITLILWIAASLAGGWFLYRMSRSLLLASATGLAVMAFCARFMVNEPNHPQHLILLLLMLACCASLAEGPLAFFLLAAIGAALLLIKINVGIFFFAALFATVVCLLRPGALQKIAGAAFFAYFLLAPIALTHRDLKTWALQYCTLAVLAGIFTFSTALFTSHNSIALRPTLLAIVAGAALVTLAVLLGTTLQGMGLHTLLEGVLLSPLKQPQLFTIPWKIPLLAVLVPALLLLVIVALYAKQRARDGDLRWISLVRGALGFLAIILTFLRQTHFFPLVMPLLPLTLLPDGDREWSLSDWIPRLFIALLPACELLQTYPVAGTQVVISDLTLIPCAFLCIHDAVAELKRHLPRLAQSRPPLPSTATLLGALLVLCLEAEGLRGGVWRPFHWPASKLAGAHSLHLYPDTEQLYTSLASDIHRNCDMLYTLPGMGSFNLWSETPTPNGMFLTAWVRALPTDQQQTIVRILQKDANSCVMVNPTGGRAWENTNADLAASPLASYILHRMKPVSNIAGYEIRINAERTRAWSEVAASARTN